MVTCSVTDCSVNHKKNPEKYTFHRFPQDPLIRGKWLKLIGRVGWSPTKNSTICSKHFIENFKRKSRINTILAKGAIPTLFVPINFDKVTMETKRLAMATVVYSIPPRLTSVADLKMVVLHVKRGDENQFLYETSIDSSVDDAVRDIVAIYNGRLKVTRICYELEELSSHGTFLPLEMQGLTEEQIKELKLEDPWAKRYAPAGYVEAKDEMGRRCGLAPPPNLQVVLKKAAETAKEYISKKHVDLRKCMTQKDVCKALNELRGATKIVFPAGLPPHDPVRMELDNVEDLAGTQAANEVIDPARACLWACGKKLLSGNKLSDHLGKNDKTKVTVKLCTSSEGAPGREPVLTEDERKQLMLQAYRKQEEWKKLEEDDDDHYMNSKWADGQNLKRQFHGMNNISWKPVLKK